MKSLLFIWALVPLVFLAGSARSQTKPSDEQHSLLSQSEIEIRNKAKKRLYPGGQDEDSLKVQAQMPPVTRKMAPASEAPIEEDSDSEID